MLSPKNPETSAGLDCVGQLHQDLVPLMWLCRFILYWGIGTRGRRRMAWMGKSGIFHI
ncbi:hypothetical protein BDV35DRAFT_94948 [Aspergillus flavus]|uniref:Uncharacterized protein n=1 Tax=Aspergillus flavus TaxID=5059 RepID=A0A5N6HAL9_ASPFL|nr:hypothetical protein BDV35DRAFT_94948 [Aspergillus flavus]